MQIIEKLFNLGNVSPGCFFGIFYRILGILKYRIQINDHSFSRIPAVELGLSADASMASLLGELEGKTFISNSDAHSMMKMGREYNIFEMNGPSYKNVVKDSIVEKMILAREGRLGIDTGGGGIYGRVGNGRVYG